MIAASECMCACQHQHRHQKRREVKKNYTNTNALDVLKFIFIKINKKPHFIYCPYFTVKLFCPALNTYFFERRKKNYDSSLASVDFAEAFNSFSFLFTWISEHNFVNEGK